MTIQEATSTLYLYSVSSSVLKCAHKDIRTIWDNGRDITLQLLPALMVMFRQERLKWLFDGHILCTAASRRSKHHSSWCSVCLGTQDKMFQSDVEAIPDMFQSNTVEHNLLPHCPGACRPSLVVFFLARWHYICLQADMNSFRYNCSPLSHKCYQTHAFWLTFCFLSNIWVDQEWAIPVLEHQYPVEFSSVPNQTQLSSSLQNYSNAADRFVWLVMEIVLPNM